MAHNAMAHKADHKKKNAYSYSSSLHQRMKCPFMPEEVGHQGKKDDEQK
jgi:hypothetical protein